MSKSIYAFNGVALTPIQINNQVYFSSKDIAAALSYSDTRKVTHIYNRYRDEFTPHMTQIVEVPKLGTSANLLTRQRVFSLRGAHLIAMFSRTPVAKEFRKWLLDLVDKEIAQQNTTALPAEPEKLPVGVWRQQNPRKPFRASVWNPDTKKQENVGSFATVDDAVFAIAEHKGRMHINKLVRENAEYVTPTQILLSVRPGKAELRVLKDAVVADRDTVRSAIDTLISVLGSHLIE